MRFHANSVCFRGRGSLPNLDRVRRFREGGADPHEVDDPYVIVQRDFEMARAYHDFGIEYVVATEPRMTKF